MLEFVAIAIAFTGGFLVGYGVRSLRSRLRWLRRLDDLGW